MRNAMDKKIQASKRGYRSDLRAQQADYLTDILKRVAPLMSVVRTGSQAEPEMSELYRALHQGRRANLAILAQSIFSRGPLRNELSVKQVTNILWQSASPEMFSLLTEVDGISNGESPRALAEA